MITECPDCGGKLGRSATKCRCGWKLAENILPGPGRKLCSYCEKVATGKVSGIWHCSQHTYDAMDGKPMTHMWGVMAKPVAGS